jgi:hypothetical protein
MYKRLKTWLDAITPSVKTTSGWVNTFTTEESDAVDIRFTLAGYGWKPLPTDTNLKSLEKGSYKISYRVSGSPTWIFHARVDSNRAQQDASTVYRSTAVELGVLASGKYEVRIEADKGSKFTAWGGTIEGIVSGGQFWSGLQVRTLAYQNKDVTQDISINENVAVNIV